MSADDLMLSVIAIRDDPDLCDAVSGGDLSKLEERELSPEEVDVLVSVAAQESAEVEGFAAGDAYFRLVDMTRGSLSPDIKAQAQLSFTRDAGHAPGCGYKCVSQMGY